MLFDNLSPKTDFSSKIQLQLDTINKNILYCTHELDKLVVKVGTIQSALALQKQVDDYFDDKETSPQTDTDEQ